MTGWIASLAPNALDDALMARQAMRLPPPRGRHPRAWPSWARRVLEVTASGLRVVVRVERGGRHGDVTGVAADLRALLLPRAP